MPKPLKTAEMAAELDFCTKTFRKYVKLYRIPHTGLGRNMRFDKAEVEAFLKNLHASAVETQTRTDLKPSKPAKPKKQRSASADRYSQLLGLQGGH
jgi:excisionase family DNA binding protein